MIKIINYSEFKATEKQKLLFDMKWRKNQKTKTKIIPFGITIRERGWRSYKTFESKTYAQSRIK